MGPERIRAVTEQWDRYLARDELTTITTDRWDDEIWGVEAAEQKTAANTKLFFYFAAKDHWVADTTRDQLIAARAATGQTGKGSKPIMEIDDVPHGWCLSECSALRKPSSTDVT